MKKLFFIIYLFLGVLVAEAQVKVHIVLEENTYIKHDSIYATGTFSNWDSTANEKFRLAPAGGNKKSITLNLPPGQIRLKFHRGSWFKVEKAFNGDEIPDRVIEIRKDTTLYASVYGWRDQLFLDKWAILSANPADTTRVIVMTSLATNYAFFQEFYNTDSAFYYAQEALKIQQRISGFESGPLSNATTYSRRIYFLQEILAVLLHSLGNYPKALELRLSNLSYAEQQEDRYFNIQALRSVVTEYLSMKDFESALIYQRRGDSLLKRFPPSREGQVFETYAAATNLGLIYYNLNRFDSALKYIRKADSMVSQVTFVSRAFIQEMLADLFRAQNQHDSALRYYQMVIRQAAPIDARLLSANALMGTAYVFDKLGRRDSALIYSKTAVELLMNNPLNVRSWGENSDSYVADYSPFLAEMYKANNQPDSAYKYLQLSVSLKDSLYNANKIRQFQTLAFNENARREQLKQQAIDAERQFRNRVKIYGLIVLVLGVVFVALMLYRNMKHKQEANEILLKQKMEIEATLAELKQTQQQLLQSEKMASLGELTAGIAHEIQNPLNFVNNFAEINSELIAELSEVRNKPEKDAALEEQLLQDIAENSLKISHHGKRADGIVKGMLQHSRISNGLKEPTDINVLADEYLRLAYHGLRAKDKTFNATLKTDFDESVGKVNLVPQDIGRVILNLITNAFYAVGERKKTDPDFEPVVSVATKRVVPVGSKGQPKIEISISDNGNGIPQHLLDRIFQPFFTTKPTGQGTGLGLSLSYDIVKAHGGNLTLTTVHAGSAGAENPGTTFLVELPTINPNHI